MRHKLPRERKCETSRTPGAVESAAPRIFADTWPGHKERSIGVAALRRRAPAAITPSRTADGRPACARQAMAGAAGIRASGAGASRSAARCRGRSGSARRRPPRRAGTSPAPRRLIGLTPRQASRTTASVSKSKRRIQRCAAMTAISGSDRIDAKAEQRIVDAGAQRLQLGPPVRNPAAAHPQQRCRGIEHRARRGSWPRGRRRCAP